MSPILVAFIILMLIAIVAFIAEIFLPTGGVLGVIGLICLISAVVMCFMIHRWLGAGVSLALLIISPFAISGALSLWQKTPIGRKLVLHTTVGELPTTHVLIGTVGTALTELRPMGECEFGNARVQACSEMSAVIPAGAQVKVIAVVDSIVTVRPLT